MFPFSWMAATAILCCVLFETFQQVSFSLSGQQRHKAPFWMSIGIVLYLCQIVTWFWLLTLLPLGVAAPLMAASYITIPIVSYFVFRERLDRVSWLGILLIVSGIVIITATGVDV